MTSRHARHVSFRPLLVVPASLLLGFGGLITVATACNPLVFGELVDQAPVRPFSLSAPISGQPYGRETLRL